MASRERKATKRFSAAIKFGGREYFLGRWPSKSDAATATRRAYVHFHGRNHESAKPTSPEELRAEARAIAKQRTTSRFHGVSWVSKHACWRAEVAVKRRGRGIGYFDNEEEAAMAHDRVALHLLGNKARLNFPRSQVRPASLETVRVEVRAQQKKNTSSRYIGVSRDLARKERPWFAMLTSGRTGLPIGRYRTEREAAIAHDRAALYYRPARVRMNFPKLAKKLVPASVDDLANELLRVVKKKTKSRFLGVTWNGFSFQAVISQKNRSTYLGSFQSEEEAAHAFDRAATRLRGKKTKLNFDPGSGEELVGRVPPRGTPYLRP